MQHGRETLTKRDGLRLSVLDWSPAGARRADVLLLHDLGDHAGRLSRLAKALVDEGFGVRALDQRGHGASAGRRGRVRDLSHLIDDVSVATTGWQGGERRPWALLGHGLGGLVALRAVQTAALSRPPDALVLVSPFLRPRHGPPPRMTRPLALLARLAPWVPFTLLAPVAMSRDPVEVEAYRRDPAVLRRPVDVGTAAALATAGAAALAPDAAPLRLPTLVLHGSDDAICDPAASAELAERTPGLTFHREPEGRHAPFHDTCRAFLTDTLIRWLVVRLDLRA